MSAETPPGDDRLTHHEFQRDQAEKRERDRIRTLVQRTIDDAYQMQGSDRVAFVADVALLGRTLAIEYSAVRRYEWGASELDLPFEERPIRRYLRALDLHDDPLDVAEAAAGDAQLDTFLSRVFSTLETAATIEGYLPNELQDVQPVQGFTGQLGERYVRADSQATGEVTLRNNDDELKSILCAGGKGSGKSTAVETLALDSFRNGHKVVDLVDFFKAENTAYDIPQQDNGKGLLETRSGMGLPTGWDDVEAGMAWLFGDGPDEDLETRPNLEILAPLCPGLAEMDVPTIPGVDKQTVRPFTIPASDLTYRQLVMLLHHTTTARENHLRSAHQTLRNSGRDWTLADVATTVRDETNAGPKIADQIETSLQTAQEKSFIRDTECPHALDWAEVMADPDTITAFTVHPVAERSDHLVVLSYLLDSLFEARKKLLANHLLNEFPALSLVMREMHEVAPRQKSEQDSESTIEGYMIDTLEDLFALTRHADMEILADTQKFKRQLSPNVSGLFDHILAFSGQVPDVREIFKTRVRPDGNPSERVAQYSDPGRCAFISEQGYRMPIQFAPPRCHHLEADTDGNGLGFRTRVDATPERLLPAPWDAEVPDRLRFGDVPDHPINHFLSQWVVVTDDRDKYELNRDVYAAYCEWADENDEDIFKQKEVSRRLKEHFDNLGSDTLYQPSVNGKRENAHRRVQLQWEFRRSRDEASMSPPTSAASGD